MNMRCKPLWNNEKYVKYLVSSISINFQANLIEILPPLEGVGRVYRRSYLEMFVIVDVVQK